MHRYLIIHFGDLEPLLYQSAVMNSIQRTESDAIFDILTNHHIDGIEFLDMIRSVLILPESYLKKRQFIKELSNQYDYIISMERENFEETSTVAQKIKCAHKIGYNRRRKIFNLEINKKPKSHIIDHYLKVCELLNIDKLRKLRLNLSKTDKEIETGKILISIHQWPSERFRNFVSLPIFQPYSLSIVSSISDYNLKSWVPITYIADSQTIDYHQYEYIITDDSLTKTIADFLEISTIFLVSKDETENPYYPIYKNSYVVAPRYKGTGVEEIELDVIIQALKMAIENQV